MTLPRAPGAVLTALFLAISSPAVAQDRVPAPAAAQPCELHVWPGHDFHAVMYGWVHGGTVDGVFKGRQGYRPIPQDPLSADRQAAELRALPIADLLALPGYAVTVHDTPLEGRAIRTATARHQPGSAPCYAELMVDDIVFHDNALSGKALNVIYRFRRFDGGETAARTYGTFIQMPLRIFPPRKPGEDPGPAIDELMGAFRASVSEFGQALNAPPRKSRKR